MTMSSQAFCVVLLLVLFAGFVVPFAQGAAVIELTPAELVSGAKVIFVGTALQASTFRENGGVWTRTEFRVEEVLKGQPGAVYWVKQYGGILDGHGYAASGVPRLRVGERYLVLLEDVASITPVRGVFQGLFHISGEALFDAFGRPIYWRGEDAPLRRGEPQFSLFSQEVPPALATAPEGFASFRARLRAILEKRTGETNQGFQTLASRSGQIAYGPVTFGDFAIQECMDNTGTPVRGWQDKTYALVRGTGIEDAGTGSQWLTALRAAIADWNSVTPEFRITLSPTPSPTYALDDGINTIMPVPEENLPPGNSWTSTLLGFTLSKWRIPSCFYIEAEIFITTELSFATDGRRNANDFQTLVGHEIGHGFGLDHPDSVTNNAIMLSTTPIGMARRVQQSDRNAVVFLYGAGTGGQADLVVTFLSAPTRATAGGRISMEVRVRNNGTVNAAPFRVGFYYSRDSVITTSDVFSNWWCTYDEGLAAGRESSCSGEIGVPASLAAGTYFLGAIADDLNQVPESVETNNSRAADTGPITLGASGGFEPSLTRFLNPGFYIVEATLQQGAPPGFWGLEVLTSRGQATGGFNLGGALHPSMTNPGFGAFLLSTPQTVTANANAQVASGASITLRFLDSNRRPIGQSAVGRPPQSLRFSLSPGFYVVEVWNSGATPATYQLGLEAQFFAGGVNTGGYLGPGIAGFGDFYVAEPQDVTIKLFGRNTYGSSGAGSMILTLKDSSRRILQVVGP